jgi:hypothetical protein
VSICINCFFPNAITKLDNVEPSTTAFVPFDISDRSNDIFPGGKFGNGNIFFMAWFGQFNGRCDVNGLYKLSSLILSLSPLSTLLLCVDVWFTEG